MQVFQQSDTAASRALQPFYAIINVIVVVVVVVGIFCPAPGRARPQLPLLGLASSAHLCQLAHCCVSPPPSPTLSLAASACAAAVRAYYWCAENVCVIAMLTFVFFAHLSARQAGRYERGQAGEGRVLGLCLGTPTVARFHSACHLC